MKVKEQPVEEIKRLRQKVAKLRQEKTERKETERRLEESEALGVSILNAVPHAVIGLRNRRIIFANSAVEAVFGWRPAELIGKTTRVLYRSDEESKKIASDFYPTLAKHQTHTEEFPCRRKDGRDIMCLVSASRIGAHLKEKGIVAVYTDITEEKKAEEELRDSEEWFHSVVEYSHEGILIVDGAYRLTYVNDELCRISGYPREEIIGRDFQEFLDADSRQLVADRYARRQRGEKIPPRYEFNIVRKNGEKRRVEISSTVIKDLAGKVMTVAQLLDITERKQAEKALQEAKERFEDLFESANELIITTDPEGWVLRLNKEVEKASGYSKKELIGQSILNIAYPEDVPKYIQFWKDMLSGLNPHYELRAISAKKPGDVRHLLASGSAVTKDGKIVEIQYNAKDITKEKQAEEQLRQSEEKYRNILESIEDGYYEVDLAGNFTFFNDSACKILGYSRNELLGMNNRECEDKQNARKAYQAFNEVYATGKPVKELEFEIIRKDGTKRFIETSASLIRDSQGEPTGFRGVARDITERKQMEAERDAMEKKAQLATRLSVVGEMASGIVHEINNPLTSVIGFAEMLAQKELPEDTREYVTIINNEGKRVASIATRLLNFARHQKPETVYTDINKLIEATIELQQYEMTTGNIKVTTKLNPHLPQTMADPGQLQQVFLNIMLNARTAMRTAHGGGKLLVKTKAMDNTIRISFKDDGPGIPKKNLQRIFNPFFTTRKTGEGTGLGLSICQGIIASHDGTIYARSKLGKGATFIIELPVVARQRKIASNGRANHINNNPWR